MAHFYGEIQGHRGVGARCGTKSKGLWGHIRGWNVGVRVECVHDEGRNCDIIRIYRTNGSNGGGYKLLATIYENAETEFADAIKERFGIDLQASKK